MSRTTKILYVAAFAAAMPLAALADDVVSIGLGSGPIDFGANI